MSALQLLRLLWTLEKPIRDLVGGLVVALKGGDAGTARLALESALRLQFEARQLARGR